MHPTSPPAPAVPTLASLRPVGAALAIAVTLAGCSGSAPALPPEFPLLAAEAPADRPVIWEIEGRRIRSLAVPIADGALPEAAARVVQSLHPGGRRVLTAREWAADGTGYRVVDRFTGGGTRSLLLGRDGAVLERWHSIAPTSLPAPVLDAVGPGRTVEAARVVHRAAEESFTVECRDRLGRRHRVHCGIDGSGARETRLLGAEVEAGS